MPSNEKYISSTFKKGGSRWKPGNCRYPGDRGHARLPNPPEPQRGPQDLASEGVEHQRADGHLRVKKCKIRRRKLKNRKFNYSIAKKMLTIFGGDLEIEERCKGMHCVDLGESFPTSIYLQSLASIQPRTSLVKFARSPRKDRPGSLLTERSRAGFLRRRYCRGSSAPSSSL